MIALAAVSALCATLLIVVVCLVWDSVYLGFAMRHFDAARMTFDQVLPSPSALTAQIGFCSWAYFINKGGAALGAAKGDK